jgi:glycosyltransferase involved in cell wall biosynthesis
LKDTSATRHPAKRVVHLTCVHPPKDVRIFCKECQSLSQAGYQVTLVAPGIASENTGGVSIEGAGTYGSRMRRMSAGAWRVYRLGMAADGEIYHFHDPELYWVGWLLKLRGKRVIYDAHEDISASVMTKPWIPPFVRVVISQAVRLLEGLTVRIVDRVIAATPKIAERFPRGKTALVQNYPIASEYVGANEFPYAERPNRIAYVGVISRLRGAVEMVQAVAQLPGELGAVLDLAGTFSPPSFRSVLESAPRRECVVEHGQLSRTEVRRVLAQARVGLVLFHPAPNHVDAQPNKLFEYMGAGIPVLASAFPGWIRILERHKCGIAVDPADAKAIAAAIQWLLEHGDEAARMGERGRAAMLEMYNWSSEERVLVDLYEGLAVRLVAPHIQK